MINNLYKKGINVKNRIFAKNFARRNFDLTLDKPIISFTFDDFPRSAAHQGMELLTKYNIKATYYISFGLINGNVTTGKICSLKDVERVIQSGNELGCHTFNHLGAYEQSHKAFEISIIENKKYLENKFPTINFSVFSFPKGQVKPQTKKIVQKYFKCSRGIIPGINNGKIDLSLLRGTRIYGNNENLEWIKKFIDQNAKEKGWLIFYTHDISTTPTSFGCTPDVFEEVIKYSRNSGSTILTVGETYNQYVYVVPV